MRLAALLCLSCCALVGAQTPSAAVAPEKEAASYAAGISLLGQLHGDAAADGKVFQKTGGDAARDALLAVSNRGQTPQATPQDWLAMHRAVDALIELFVWQKQIFKASVFANFQYILYHNYEGDEGLALAAAQRSLALQQQSGVKGTLYIPWENVGQGMIRLGRVEEGIAALKQALAVVDEPKSAGAASIWLELVEVLIADGKSEEAHAQLREFLSKSEASPAKVFRGRALLAQSNVEIAEGHYKEALNALKQANDAVKGDAAAENFTIEVLSRLLLVGMNAMTTASYPEAKALLARMEQEFPGMPISIAGFAHEVLNHRRRLAGEFDALLHEDTAALETARASHDAEAQASALLTLAVDYEYVNEATQAITSLEEATRVMNAAPAPGVSVYLRYRVMLTLANAYLEKKDAGRAGATLRTMTQQIDALSSGAAKLRMASLYGEAQLARARAAMLDDDPDTAREILAKALQPKPGQFGKYTRSDVLLQAARTERDAKEKPAEAVRLYLATVDELRKEKDVRTEIAARLQLAQYLAIDARKLAGSQETAMEQVRLARAATQSIVLADARWRLDFVEGVLAQNAGRNDAAIALFRRAASELDEIRGSLTQGEQRQAFLDDDTAQELYRRLEALLTGAGQADAAWEMLERDKARAFLESLRGRRFKAADGAADGSQQKDLLALEQQIVSTRVQLTPQNEAVMRGAGQQPEVLQAKLRELESKFALVRQQAGLAHSRASQPLSLQPVKLRELQRMLRPRSALVEYAVLDGELAAFVVTRTTARELHWAVDTKSLPAKLREFHDQLASPDAGAGWKESVDSMSALVFGEVAKNIPARTDSLVIVPAQGLAYIPFGALKLPDGGMVLDRYTVTYLPSASTLQYLHDESGNYARSTPFVGALGNVSVDGWPPLPGTLTEAKGIRAVYPAVQPVTGTSFTHDVAVKALETRNEVHFATHGLFDEEAPLFSALLVAPSPGAQERLSLYEVMDLRLKAKLVVLSACETNRGRLTGGDEVLGLTRTFLQAGANDVVSSLWKVSDDSTAMLMQTFHVQLHAGKQPAQALRAAALAVRTKYPAPFYWAAFVNTGVD